MKKETRKVDPKYYKGDQDTAPEMSDEWHELIFNLVDEMIASWKKVGEIVSEDVILKNFDDEYTTFHMEFIANKCIQDEVIHVQEFCATYEEYYTTGNMIYGFQIEDSAHIEEGWQYDRKKLDPWDIFPAEKRMVERYVSKY